MPPAPLTRITNENERATKALLAISVATEIEVLGAASRANDDGGKRTKNVLQIAAVGVAMLQLFSHMLYLSTSG